MISVTQHVVITTISRHHILKGVVPVCQCSLPCVGLANMRITLIQFIWEGSFLVAAPGYSRNKARAREET